MFGEEKILDSFATLSRAKQLAFALLVFERMLPSLTAFSMDTGFAGGAYVAVFAMYAALLSQD